VSATSSPQIAQEQTVAPAVVIGATNMASKYEILEQIGSGTYGYVFRGRVRGSDKVVALKKIKLDDPRPEPQRDGVRYFSSSARVRCSSLSMQ
jgi:serine/threonine protein kinase